MSLRILGIDPGLNITGYGVLEADDGRLRLCEAGVIRGKSRGSLTKRLVEIHEGVAEVIASLKPEVMALEELYSHYARPRTAILMGHARGRDLPGRGPGRHSGGALLGHADQAHPDRQRPGAEVAGAAGDPARTGPGGPARAARRGRRPGRGAVPLLPEGQAGRGKVSSMQHHKGE